MAKATIGHVALLVSAGTVLGTACLDPNREELTSISSGLTRCGETAGTPTLPLLSTDPINKATGATSWNRPLAVASNGDLYMVANVTVGPYMRLVVIKHDGSTYQSDYLRTPNGPTYSTLPMTPTTKATTFSPSPSMAMDSSTLSAAFTTRPPAPTTGVRRSPPASPSRPRGSWLERWSSHRTRRSLRGPQWRVRSRLPQ